MKSESTQKIYNELLTRTSQLKNICIEDYENGREHGYALFNLIINNLKIKSMVLLNVIGRRVSLS